MRKSKVITNYARVKQNNLATEAQTIHDSLDGNTDFPATPVTMAAFLVLIKDFVLKLANAFHGTPTQTSAKNESQKLLLNAISKNGVYVNATADGDEVMLLSSGYTMAKTPQPKGPLAIPPVFTVTASREPGRAAVEFAGLPGVNYIVRMTKDTNVSRNLWPTTVETRRSFIVDGLLSGDRYTFIGAYKGASNVLNFTPPVEVVIQ